MGLRSSAREQLRQLMEGTSGSRFQDRYDATPTPRAVVRITLVLVGVLLIAAGIVMLVVPGPGLVVILLGLGVLAVAMRWAAALFDAVERLGVRVWSAVPEAWRRSRLVKALVLVGLVVGAVVTAAVSLWIGRFLLG